MSIADGGGSSSSSIGGSNSCLPLPELNFLTLQSNGAAQVARVRMRWCKAVLVMWTQPDY